MNINLVQANKRRYSCCMKQTGRKPRGKMLTVQEFRSQFDTEEQCGEQLGRQRWPEGFACPRCGGPSRGYMASRQVHECARCSYQCSVRSEERRVGKEC